MRRYLHICALLPLVAGCDTQVSKVAETPISAPAEIVLFAATSTGDACQKFATDFEKRGDVKVLTSFASSGTLARQIVQGAPAHLFLSANIEWADAVQEAGLVAQRIDLLSNRIVVILHEDSKFEVQEPADLLDDRIRYIAIGETTSTPVGMYSKQALEKHGLWDKLSEKLVPTKDVRQALALVERKEVDASIVYATDAKVGTNIKVAMVFDESDHEPIRYPLLLLDSSNSLAKELFDEMRSPAAQDTFMALGFQFLPVDQK